MLAFVMPSMEAILICLAIGFVIALIVCGILWSQLKSVRFKNSASDYVRRDSLVLTLSRDIFLYRNVTRTPRPKNNK